MRWRTWDKSGEHRDKKMQWRKWFAWYPVVIFKEYPGYSLCKYWAWFEWVERRGLYTDTICSWVYEYRERSKEGGKV